MKQSQEVAGLRVGHLLSSISRMTVVGLAAAGLLAACSSSSKASSPAPIRPTLAAVPVGSLGVVVSSDAASVSDVAIPAFRRSQPGQAVDVDVVPADRLVAAASTPGMTAIISSNQAILQSLAQTGVAYQPVEFVRSILQLVTARPDVKNIQSLADLPGGASVGILPSDTAAGLAAQSVLAGAGLHPVVYASSSALIKAVDSGRVEAGLLDLADVDAAGSAIRAFDLPSGTGATDYYVSLTKKSSGNAAQQFIASLVAGPSNQALISANYLQPEGGTSDSGDSSGS